jgi:transcriptional regulator with XRE-family HTH domain
MMPADVARLRTLRRRRGWTRAQLAEAAGVGEATVARIEAGVGRGRGGGGPQVRVGTMTRIAEALGVRITDVDEFRDEEQPPPRR